MNLLFWRDPIQRFSPKFALNQDKWVPRPEVSPGTSLVLGSKGLLRLAWGEGFLCDDHHDFGRRPMTVIIGLKLAQQGWVRCPVTLCPHCKNNFTWGHPSRQEPG